MALLAEIQRVFENTYGRPAGVDLEACLVGPRRCAELAARSATEAPEMSAWARFFYYVDGRDLRLALFFSDAMIAALEARDPRRGVGEANVLPFLVLAEEASHALHTTLAFGEGGSARVHAPGFLAELELLARIDAYLLLVHFVQALTPEWGPRERAWVRHHALERWDVGYDDAALEARYRGAVRRAVVFVDHLDRLAPADRVAELRRFRRLPSTAKHARLERLASRA